MAKASKMNRKKVQADTVLKLHELATSAEMVVRELPNGQILAKDDAGMYITRKHYVGTGLLDPFRSAQHKRQDYNEEAEPANTQDAETD